MAAAPTRLTEVADPDVIAEICRFRARVWQATGKLKKGAFGDEGWRDAIDGDCRHWVIRSDDGALIAAGRLSVHDSLADVYQAEEYERYGLELSGRVALPDRVVVCPTRQGGRLAWRILDAQDESAVEQGAQHAVRQASPGMVRLLRRRGWTILGPATADARFPGEVFQVATLSFDHEQASWSDVASTAPLTE